MATLKQKKLAENIVLNAVAEDPLNKQELVVSAGYSEVHAEANASTIIESVGVQEELANLGFTTEGAKAVVEQILYDRRVKPETRISAAREVFKVQGSYAAEKVETKNLNVNVDVQSDVDLAELAKATADQLKLKKTQ